MIVPFYSNYRSLFLIIFFTVIILLSGTVRAEKQVYTHIVEVIGTGRIYKNNTAQAREHAITNSMVYAIEKVISELLPLDSMVQNFKILNNIFYENTGEYVQDYKVLAEAASDKLFRVMVQATVSTERIKERLLNAGITIGERTLPKILFFISEKSLEDILPKYWWSEDLSFSKVFSEEAMDEKFKKEGFSVIGHGYEVQNMATESGINNPDLSIPEAISFGSHMQADVVIMGTAMAEITPNIMGGKLKSFKGTVKVRAIWTDTGEEFTFTTKTAVTVNADDIAGCNDALSSAGSLAGEELASLIAVAWQKKVEEPEMIEIMVKGTSRLANFVKFRKTLNEMPGIKDVRIIEMKSDEALIVVYFKGDSKALADALMIKTFDTFGINIYEVSPINLKIELIPSSDLVESSNG